MPRVFDASVATHHTRCAIVCVAFENEAVYNATDGRGATARNVTACHGRQTAGNDRLLVGVSTLCMAAIEYLLL